MSRITSTYHASHTVWSQFQVMLKKARIRRFKERKMFSVIREIALYAMFVWVVLVIAYGHRDPNSHVLNQGIENMLTGKGNSWLVDYTLKKPRNESTRKFLKVTEKSESVFVCWNHYKVNILFLQPKIFNLSAAHYGLGVVFCLRCAR